MHFASKRWNEYSYIRILPLSRHDRPLAPLAISLAPLTFIHSVVASLATSCSSRSHLCRDTELEGDTGYPIQVIHSW
jgi:hypothetical protein